MSSINALHSSSTVLEQDARHIHDDRAVSAGNIAIGVIIGRTSEFFDFFVYAIASVLVFPGVFFPMVDSLTGTMYSFSIFALAFIARPIGSFVFMAIDRRHGRGTKLTVALFLLGGSTAAISFLPSYASLGIWAIIFLATFRFLQGFALGGAWDGLASLLALNAPENQRGWYAMVPQLGAPLGFAIAAALFAYFVSSLSTQEFLDWGWRYPFFVAFAINVVALFARLRLVMTKEFGTLLERHELGAVRTSELLRFHGRDILLGAFVPLASFALFHLVTVFPLGWINLFADESPATFLSVQIIGAAVCVLAIIASGALADRIGRRSQLGIGAALIALFAIGGPLVFNTGSASGAYAFVIVGFGLLGLSFGQAAGAVAARFGQTYRYSGSALTSDLAWLIGAGFAPLVALTLASTFGLWAIGLYLLSGAICTLLALAVNRHLETQD
ncbi:MFS transporter [Limoniibacter endophyticus]|uniref:ABC transporter permease n=1 Tax=Limoniibacter endophyticus TaxID=1565040 RepID=A0A8J3DLZ9_9HYPH|nr:MFS transporter [Limoniibacter endophyticus]GHC81258.1 ABC transporter permease [Limoniibacter endophyticus]